MAPLAMRAPRPSTPLQLGLSWLVWLAMLLPTAQFAAATHAYSHLVLPAGSAGQDRQVPHQTHCDLCLTAASVSGGVLPGVPASLPAATARHALPQAPLISLWQAAGALAYRSRAPPPVPR
jgi:hypothetical protein